MEDTNVIVEPVPSLAPVQTTAPVVEPAKDLISKVAEFKKNQTATAPKTSQESFFDYKEIEKIADPVAREFAKKAYDSMQSAFTKKTQEIAYGKSTYENKLKEMENWTPERIQRELSNPQFVQAAQKYAEVNNPPNSGLTDEQFSAMTDVEKARILALENKISSLEQTNIQALVSQRDSQLQQRYPDYNPTKIDATIRELAQMSPLDIREHVHKSLMHDSDVTAAYEMGLQEAKGNNQNKINAITPNGSFASTSEDVPVRGEKESSQEYHMRLMQYRLAQFRNRK